MWKERKNAMVASAPLHSSVPSCSFLLSPKLAISQSLLFLGIDFLQNGCMMRSAPPKENTHLGLTGRVFFPFRMGGRQTLSLAT
jgi:hypothetical protein